MAAVRAAAAVAVVVAFVYRVIHGDRLPESAGSFCRRVARRVPSLAGLVLARSVGEDSVRLARPRTCALRRVTVRVSVRVIVDK